MNFLEQKEESESDDNLQNQNKKFENERNSLVKELEKLPSLERI